MARRSDAAILTQSPHMATRTIANGKAAAVDRLEALAQGRSNIHGCRKSLDATIDSLAWLSNEEKAAYKKEYADDRDGTKMASTLEKLSQRSGSLIFQKKQERAGHLDKAKEAVSKLNDVKEKLKQHPDDSFLLRKQASLASEAQNHIYRCRHAKAEMVVLQLNDRTLNMVKLNLDLQRTLLR